ncbi:hypothetical protein Fmac_018362 [Flemingia macrophylla]|uniref:Uncharacterized protein n=1 Tax=Flemingia macrophylla TaxID=520843 RepID=A0ABD1M4W3_9FABA
MDTTVYLRLSATAHSTSFTLIAPRYRGNYWDALRQSPRSTEFFKINKDREHVVPQGWLVMEESFRITLGLLWQQQEKDVEEIATLRCENEELKHRDPSLHAKAFSQYHSLP